MNNRKTIADKGHPLQLIIPHEDE